MIQTIALRKIRSAVRPRPRSNVTGVINDASQVEAALDDLASAGFPRESVSVLHGAYGARVIGTHGGRFGVSAWMEKLARLMGGADQFAGRHADEAASGRYVVAVTLPADSIELRDRASAALKSHGGHYIVLDMNRSYTLLEY
ncbi:MAG: hypothetical protein L0177_05755 [Chloroflexi bacterium]|nr:hypothetical protein [Chloroflexota bacterium]